ncbi:DNA-binding protein RFX2-like isoform X2 [Pomacea canaliculata]|uniref:DNA-binding protein RFX2-like isoform X2 n=1 Tax=Pomacea canaliculata TaxID=400727 RepID=UPI000D725E20|nr:DNA-binding protein RFX2-like isoform X2 [Pomacea canaliculata]
MATQTYVTDLQAMNPNAVQMMTFPCQAFGLDLTADGNGSVVKTTTNQGTVGSAQKIGQTTTIIQPAQAHTGQQFIVASSTVEQLETGAGDTITLQAGGQTVYPVQYVESNDAAIYANGQMQNYQEYGQSTMYTPVSGTYYQTAGGTQVTTGLVPVGSSVQTIQGQLIQQPGGGTYLIQGGTMDGEGTPLTHTTRASPATVQWLLDNYETAEGVSLPRSTLYFHYLRHCQEQNLDPMNPASFGKLIRSVFLGLRTRRLGTRGNSKYHYYGIRIKANSPLNQFTDDQTMAMRQQPMYATKKPASSKTDMGEAEGGQGGATGPTSEASQVHQQHQQFLGDTSMALPSFGSIDISATPLPEGITVNDLRIFEKLYKEHAEAVVDVVVNLQFSLIESLWQAFWRNNPPEQRSSLLYSDYDFEKRLPKEKLFVLCRYEPVQKYVRRADYAFYQALVEVLIPDVLRPIPSSLTQAIRNFAKSLEGWLKAAMQGVPEEMIRTKVGAVSAFAQTLRRYTSLNHLAQAARAVLQNTSQINQMLTDLNRVDFANVQEQASWVCQCEDAVVQQLEQDFKKTLKQGNSLEQWAMWLETVVNQVLKPHEGSPYFPKAARQFLLKWSFYSSMVIRDLTLRSAASFGSFHLIRLLYDEFMFYLVEHKVANATGETPIAVMGEVRQFIDLSSAVALSTLESDKPPVSSAPALARSAESAIVSPATVPTTLMLITSNTGTAAANMGTTITVRPTANGIVNTTSGTAGSNTVVVLSGASSATTAPSHTISTAQGSISTAVTVRTATAGGQPGKTLMLMPITATPATVSVSDMPAAKRMKPE